LENEKKEIKSSSILLKSATIVNEGKKEVSEELIKNGSIEKICKNLDPAENIKD
jgi:dihydroorotase-like cyclic amidohydrolase